MDPGYPPMSHLPGFWDETNWSDACWKKYRKRRKGFVNKIKNKIDQAFHRLLGQILSYDEWTAREAGQWPSKTGSYDPCEDHWNWLKGAGQNRAAELLKLEAVRRRAKFGKHLGA